MPNRSMQEIFADLGDELLDDFDAIAREAHETYRSYPQPILIEHDSRAQANCTYTHMVASAHRRFLDRAGVRPLNSRGLKVWLFEDAGVVIRFKKMDEDGRTRSYPTAQARAFDEQRDLPGIPPKPVRLSAGYLLDASGSELVRAQLSRPDGRGIQWCGAIIPREDRKVGESIWVDVTRQARFS